ncbi:MAG: hypothetical protein ACPLQO_10750 [Desulfotomaculales bacterium]
MSNWLNQVILFMNNFAEKYSVYYSKTFYEISAAFEIGCFLSLVKYYESKGCTVKPKNLGENNEYRYLTTPNGNPDNFSFLSLEKNEKHFQLRQQVRILCSHIDQEIAFTPDIVVIKKDTEIINRIDNDYANGKRRFFCIDSNDVIAAHECKSLVPFPELLVSFIGLVFTAHSWLLNPNDCSMVDNSGLHLAPTLFIGGTARGLHIRMINSMKRNFPINIVTGIHLGWNLFIKNNDLKYLRDNIFY